MTQNKFWLVWSPEIHNTSYKYEALKSAKAEAIRLTKDLNKEFYVLEATHSFKADVNIIETSFEATPDESLVAYPDNKFKVGDEVLYQEKDESGVYWFDGIVIDIIDDEYLKIQDKINQKIFTFSLSLPQVKLAKPTTDETPKHNFKVGDIVIVNNCDNEKYWIDDMFEMLNKKEKHKITKIENTKEYMYCTLDDCYEFNAKCLLKSE